MSTAMPKEPRDLGETETARVEAKRAYLLMALESGVAKLSLQYHCALSTWQGIQQRFHDAPARNGAGEFLYRADVKQQITELEEALASLSDLDGVGL